MVGYYFSVSDRLSTGIAVADIDLSLIDSVREKMPIAKVNFVMSYLWDLYNIESTNQGC